MGMSDETSSPPPPKRHLMPSPVPPPLSWRRLSVVFFFVNVSIGLGWLVAHTAGRAYREWYARETGAVAQVVETAQSAPAPVPAPEPDSHDVCAAHYAALLDLLQRPQHVLGADRGEVLLEGGLVVKLTGVYSTEPGFEDFESVRRAIVGRDVMFHLPDLATFRTTYQPEARSAFFPGEAAPAAVAGVHYGLVPVIADPQGFTAR